MEDHYLAEDGSLIFFFLWLIFKHLGSCSFLLRAWASLNEFTGSSVLFLSFIMFYSLQPALLYPFPSCKALALFADNVQKIRWLLLIPFIQKWQTQGPARQSQAVNLWMWQAEDTRRKSTQPSLGCQWLWGNPGAIASFYAFLLKKQPQIKTLYEFSGFKFGY